MKYFCTLSDLNYLNRGLSLIDSLNKHNSDIFVYYLCLDDACYDAAKLLNIENVEFISYRDVIKDDPRFEKIIPSREAINCSESTTSSPVLLELAYRMSSYFSYYCLNKFDIDHVIYSDSDIYFYESLDSIYDDVNNFDVGFVEHRIKTNCGRFNVGIIYFKNNIVGKEIVKFWSDCVMNPDNPYSAEYGTCGDQKYLDLIYKLYTKHIAIIGNTNSITGHLAPWNYASHMYTDDGQLVWMGKNQKLTYIHFSNFVVDFQNDTYKIAPRHGIDSIVCTPWVNASIDLYYQNIKERTTK